MNKYIQTIIITPMTTTIRNYKSRITIEFNGKQGVMLDQTRTIDKQRLVKKLGDLTKIEIKQVLSLLKEMFSY